MGTGQDFFRTIPPMVFSEILETMRDQGHLFVVLLDVNFIESWIY